jgi:hypothetical protein
MEVVRNFETSRFRIPKSRHEISFLSAYSPGGPRAIPAKPTRMRRPEERSPCATCYLFVMGHLILYASVMVVGALAMRPKLSLAVMSTLPVALALAETRIPGGMPDWMLIAGLLVTAYCLAAVIVAFLFRRGGDVGGTFGSLPIGHEARYSAADKSGLWYTFGLLCIAAAGSGVVAFNPPDESVAVRVTAAALAAAFAGLAGAFWMLLSDREIAIRFDEEALEIVDGRGASTRTPWSDVAGHTFRFGIFRVYDKAGSRLLRVDNTIDGFVGLLYHVNRKTFRTA